LQHYLTSSDQLLDAQFSPNGQLVAYSRLERGRPEIYLAGFPFDPNPVRITPNGGAVPRWRHDGGAVYFLAPDKTFYTVEVNTAGPSRLQNPRPLFKVPVFVETWGLSTFEVDTSAPRFLFVIDENSGPAQFVVITS
jgi:hypothetical protein